MEVWEAVMQLLLHRHMWVRKASARLLGAALSSPTISPGLWSSSPTRAAELAFSLFLQLECEAADEAACRQAVKCLVSVAAQLAKVEAAQPPQPAAANPAAGSEEQAEDDEEEGSEGADGEEEGTEGADGEEEEEEEAGEGEEEGDEAGPSKRSKQREEAGDDDEDDDDDGDDSGRDLSMSVQYKLRAFTLRGLVRRMARLADNSRYAYTQQRLAALRWIAALASTLGGEYNDISTSLVHHTAVLYCCRTVATCVPHQLSVCPHRTTHHNKTKRSTTKRNSISNRLHHLAALWPVALPHQHHDT